MGSKRPKWLIKQHRKRIADARRLARAKNPGTKDLGVPRMAHHGGHKEKTHPTRTS
jgi:hypothetical protein